MLALLAAWITTQAAADPATTSISEASLLVLPQSQAKAGDFSVAKVPPTIDIHVITGLPDKGKQTLWSTWGDGCYTKSGKYFTSIGDHLGIDSTSHIYEYDPATKKLTLVVDVFRDLNIKPGTYGHGKVHSGIHEAADGWLYFSTYWGKHREIDAHFGKDFEGSLLLRFHPDSKKLENLGAIVPRQGLPASHFDEKRGLLYFYAVYKNDVCVYDIGAKQLAFLGGGEIVAGNRTFMRDADGRVYFTGQDESLHYYDPKANKIVKSKAALPQGTNEKAKNGDTLRAAVQRPAKSGVIYGMTATGALFAFDPKSETVRDLGPNFGAGHYTAVMVASPDDRFLYYFPGAHGSSGATGTALVQYEIATGKRKVLAFLTATLLDRVKWNAGGTYNLQIDEKGERLFATFNGNPADAAKPNGFGLPAVMVIHVPKEER